MVIVLQRLGGRGNKLDNIKKTLGISLRVTYYKEMCAIWYSPKEEHYHVRARHPSAFSGRSRGHFWLLLERRGTFGVEIQMKIQQTVRGNRTETSQRTSDNEG